ncbi:uncharacterized protein N7518_005985 [Penicillium psychrosexuale]|uniref:uncharacterized protein n=1 Tax=Penicillium psychrosexuale TaxID=1002107 RepID=UPI00254576CD|nr:uncharacterized protein N7518_005985 [Penicillium psychrosexuale]KAJ5788974.1 hypothetical protein N7518_005985 [Penicillium psychrosexuale]
MTTEIPAKLIQPSRHVVLPFNLREKRTFHRDSAQLMQLFPDTKRILFDSYFLVFLLGSLPPKPWPLTIAGVQPYFTTDPNDEGPMPSMKRISKSRLFVDAEINVTDLPPSQVDNAFKLVFDFFTKAQISITQVQLTEPTADVVDSSKYDILHPGVMLSSGICSPTEPGYLTTSDVLVEDSNSGERYIAVASHGFPHGGKVFHPCASGKEIGQIIMEITHTGIAIAKLHDDVPYVNDTFESPFNGIQPTQLRDFVSADSLKPGDTVYMNSPFVGYSEGICGPHTRERIPCTDPSQPIFEWIKTRWCYMGQGSTDSLQDGACGSAIWNKDGNVNGFFRFAPASGHFLDWSFCVGADHIIERGSKIVH